ncbi:MAG: S49 family peptidase, partial [Devosia sp.]
FLPEKPEDIARIKQMETDIHKVFIDWVKSRRGDLFKLPDDQLFTGEFWSGVKGLELGLVDALGDIHETLRTRFGDDVRTRLIEPKRGLFRLPSFGFGGALGGSLTADLVATIEDRALWSRLGL